MQIVCAPNTSTEKQLKGKLKVFSLKRFVELFIDVCMKPAAEDLKLNLNFDFQFIQKWQNLFSIFLEFSSLPSEQVETKGRGSCEGFLLSSSPQ
jgi:hypothetical protein